VSNYREIKTDQYSVFVGNVLQQLDQFITQNYSASKKFILVDSNTIEHCLPVLDFNDVTSLSDAEVLEVDAGEEHKQIETCAQLWAAMSELEADRKSLVINLGGGVIGDMGGFVAATYQRGIDFIQVPTTLLSMVDASVGGKLGVDLGVLKNQVGLFQHPKAVFIDPVFLETLPERELKSGYAEMLKHGLITSPKHWQEVTTALTEEKIPDADLIFESVSIKNDIVTADFKESGKRKLLNFGHTAGHAIESMLLEKQQPVLHGEAVIAGMIVESYTSLLEETLDEQSCTKIVETLLRNYNQLPVNEKDIDQLLGLMKTDKKNQNGAINFTLLKAIGEGSENHTPDTATIIQSLKKYMA
tara:strand:+ start:25343 stop:26416 length:1074 start_codon:yes stop_codon:yes gene_type:complete